MTTARDRADRKGSTPIQIGNTKLTTDSSNNLNILDNSDAPKKLIASEIEIGDSSNKVIIKKGSDNKVAFQTQASGQSATDSNAGGGVTVVADTTALQALTNNSVGDLVFVSANNKLYLRQTNGWYTVATVANATPVISSAGNASYSFATDGTPIVITVTATDAEGETITYAHTVSSGSLTNGGGATATVVQGTGNNVNQFTITPSTNSAYAGSFSLTFTAQDPNGNTATSSASSFSLSFDVSGSLYFDGSGDYISTPSSSDFQMGTGDFTIEAWVYSTSYSNNPYILDLRAGGGSPTSQPAPLIYIDSSNNINYYVNGSAQISTSYSSYQNKWTHISVVKNSGTTTLFLDGVSKGTYSDSVNYNQSNSQAIIGMRSGYNSQSLNGYISNLRIVKGSAVYTSNFTPPNTPLTAINNTVYLIASNIVPINGSQTEDASSSSHTLNFYGNLAYSYATPFLNGSGGSVLFDGNGDAVTVTANADFAYGTGDFTIEAWVYSTTYAHFPYIFDGRTNTGSSSNAPALYIHSSNTLNYYVAGSNQISTSYSSYQNQWTHICIVRNSGSTTLYLDGVSKGTWSDSTNYTDQGPFVIGRHGNSSNATYCLNGYISNFRIVKGTAVYTSNFTVPTSQLTAITNTKLLTCNDSNVINDASSSNHTITSQGNSIPTKFIPF